MFEKVSPAHPDKLADRIAGALVDLAYAETENPHIAVEVLVGHGHVYIIAETDTPLEYDEVLKACRRISGENIILHYDEHRQDKHLAENQKYEFRCGDNGIFRGVPVTLEQAQLCAIAHKIYEKYPTDGKYILDQRRLIICQSRAEKEDLAKDFPAAEINPLGFWTGGIWVDSGATNRKLGSDLADSITGGGIHGKDLSKADVSCTIYAWVKAQQTGKPVELCCAIGDTEVDGVPYSEIVETARHYIKLIGGFEKLAEWGLVQ